MKIIISKEPENLEINKNNKNENFELEIERAVELIGKFYDVEDSEVSITLTNDKKIHELNKNYRGIDKATDVLSFAFHESEEPEIIFDEEESVNDVLGDIIISVERAAEQAEEYGHSFKREVVFLTVHGMLHLLGYDHMEEDDRIEMEMEQNFIMNKLGISRE